MAREGWPTLRGSRTVNPDQPWEVDAPVTARLREAGAVLLGKTTTPEFGCKGETNSPATGITRNPWNLSKTPGGSSGGTAAAVAAGLGPLSVGTDGAGSVRDATGLVAGRYDGRPGTTYLVRPDQHVAARFRQFDVAALLEARDRAMGRVREAVA